MLLLQFTALALMGICGHKFQLYLVQFSIIDLPARYFGNKK